MRQRRLMIGTLIGLGLAAGGNQASASVALVPMAAGAVTGAVNTYTVKAGDTLPKIAASHGVHPIRITKPSAGVLKDGLERGDEIFIDQRHIKPRFQPWVSGIVLNVPEAHVYYVEKGSLVADYPVAVSMSDWKVPIGEFKVRSMEKHPTWYVPPKIQDEMRKNGEEVKTKVPPGPDNPLGTRWIGFADNTYGFHGTLAPTSIKTYASHGCVRFLTPHIEDLYGRVKIGDPVRVYYQPVKLAVDKGAVWVAAYPDLYSRGYDYRAAVKALAEQAEVSEHLNWKVVEEAITAKDGIIREASRPENG